MVLVQKSRIYLFFGRHDGKFDILFPKISNAEVSINVAEVSISVAEVSKNVSEVSKSVAEVSIKRWGSLQKCCGSHKNRCESLKRCCGSL